MTYADDYAASARQNLENLLELEQECLRLARIAEQSGVLLVRDGARDLAGHLTEDLRHWALKVARAEVKRG